MIPESDLLSPSRSSSSLGAEDWTVKASREAQLLLAAVKGIEGAAAESISADQWANTAAKVTSSAAISVAVAAMSKGRGIFGVAASAAAVATTIAFATDIVRHGKQVFDATKDAWETEKNLADDKLIFEENAGQFLFDSVLMTLAGSATTRVAKFSHSSGRNKLATEKVNSHSVGERFEFNSNSISKSPNLIMAEQQGSKFQLAPHESSHGMVTTAEIEPLHNLLRVFEDPVTAPKSMSPKAYKVLNQNGTSIYEPRAKYPLPQKGPDGQWIPGKWVEPGQDSPMLKAVQVFGTGEKGIYVSAVPTAWYALESGKTTFEIEIGDAKSITNWTKPGSLIGDFAAQRIRLLRPLDNEEILQLERLDGSSPSLRFGFK